ncbi:MAG: Deoxyribodipyrimidine photo-lyase-related protein [Aeromicrobium sp.]|nr:Deoxyribodipyrimidine photo-lyase-related protein [Aeromicrobium sp.]
MQHFYSWQRQRLDILVHGDQAVGVQWSFDEDNRKKLPRKHPVPAVRWPERHPEVDAAIAWVTRVYDGMAPEKEAAHTRAASPWLS